MDIISNDNIANLFLFISILLLFPLMYCMYLIIKQVF